MDEFMVKLREFLKKKRTSKKLSQSQIANLMGYESRTGYHSIENGPTVITVLQLKTLIPILDITKEDLEYIFLE